MIKVTVIPGKGRGVVATADIRRGTLIVTAPILTFPRGTVSETPFYDLCWKTEDDKECLALGPQTLCNDSDTPNCVSFTHDETDLLVAIQPIKNGEELTLCYADFDF